MAATVSGSKTLTTDYAPHLTAATLNTILATAVENLTKLQLKQLNDAIRRVSHDHNDSTTLGAILH